MGTERTRMEHSRSHLSRSTEKEAGKVQKGDLREGGKAQAQEQQISIQWRWKSGLGRRGKKEWEGSGRERQQKCSDRMIQAQDTTKASPCEMQFSDVAGTAGM